VTAHAVKGDRARFRAAGMDGYLAKPFDLDQFRNLLRDVATRPAPVREAADEAPFDLEERALRFRHIQGTLPELLALFRDNSGGYLETIRRSLDHGDLEGAARAAHTFKGMAAVVCAKGVRRVAGELEAAARGKDLAACRTLLPLLHGSLGKALNCLNTTGGV